MGNLIEKFKDIIQKYLPEKKPIEEKDLEREGHTLNETSDSSKDEPSFQYWVEKVIILSSLVIAFFCTYLLVHPYFWFGYVLIVVGLAGIAPIFISSVLRYFYHEKKTPNGNEPFAAERGSEKVLKVFIRSFVVVFNALVFFFGYFDPLMTRVEKTDVSITFLFFFYFLIVVVIIGRASKMIPSFESSGAKILLHILEACAFLLCGVHSFIKCVTHPPPLDSLTFLLGVLPFCYALGIFWTPFASCSRSPWRDFIAPILMILVAGDLYLPPLITMRQHEMG